MGKNLIFSTIIHSSITGPLEPFQEEYLKKLNAAENITQEMLEEEPQQGELPLLDLVYEVLEEEQRAKEEVEELVNMGKDSQSGPFEVENVRENVAPKLRNALDALEKLPTEGNGSRKILVEKVKKQGQATLKSMEEKIEKERKNVRVRVSDRNKKDDLIKKGRTAKNKNKKM